MRRVWILAMGVLWLAAACGGGEVREGVEEELIPAEEPAEAATAEPPEEELPPEPTPLPSIEEEPEAALPEPEPAGSSLERALAGEFGGAVVTVLGAAADEDAFKMEESLRPFVEATGIEVIYEGTNAVEPELRARLESGQPPDIVSLFQPTLLAQLAQEGVVVDVGGFLDPAALSERYNESWLDMATVEGPQGPIMAGVWHRAEPKSLVYYPKAVFEAAGYQVPGSWGEMMALTQALAETGQTAWCIGIESGPATGWVATDWIENILLRTVPLEAYDGWVRGDLPFSAPEVRQAVELLSEIWFNDAYVRGGREAIVAIPFSEAPLPMFEQPPGCWFHAQGSFITRFFPEELQAGADYDFFYLPPIDPAFGNPVLISGTIMTMLEDRPEVRALMAFFSSGASLEGWIRLGGAISPHLDSDLAWYVDEQERQAAELLRSASSVRFDGSDQMPGEVGAGAFWHLMTEYVAGGLDLDTALAEIDAAWPR